MEFDVVVSLIMTYVVVGKEITMVMIRESAGLLIDDLDVIIWNDGGGERV